MKLLLKLFRNTVNTNKKTKYILVIISIVKSNIVFMNDYIFLSHFIFLLTYLGAKLN